MEARAAVSQWVSRLRAAHSLGRSSAAETTFAGADRSLTQRGTRAAAGLRHSTLGGLWGTRQTGSRAREGASFLVISFARGEAPWARAPSCCPLTLAGLRSLLCTGPRGHPHGASTPGGEVPSLTVRQCGWTGCGVLKQETWFSLRFLTNEHRSLNV